MSTPLSPSPLEAAKQFVIDQPDFIGVLCVMSYQPAGRNGRMGLVTKETHFYIGPNHRPKLQRPRNAQEFHEQVGALLDVRQMQTGFATRPVLVCTPGLKTPAQIQDLAMTARFRRMMAPKETTT